MTVHPSGRVVSYSRGIALVVEHSWIWYQRNWHSTAVSSVLQPLLFLLAFGIGFGSLVGDATATDGVPYLVWLAPALLAVSAVQSATFESTYPVLSGFKWQRIYVAISSGPLTPAQLALGCVSWTACKIGVSGVVYVAVIAVFGGVAGPGILVSLLIAVLTGVAVAAPITAYAATVENEGASFNVILRFIVIPMTLFSGTFFPVDRLPEWVQPLTWVSPLWHGTVVARDAALGTLDPLPALGHVAYLLALIGVGTVLAARLFTRRLHR